MSEDRTNDTLIAYDKNGNVVAQGTMGDSSITISNLTPATSYNAGDFTVAFSNKNGVSDKVAVPAFTTEALPAQSTQPASSAVQSSQPASSAVDPTSSASSQAAQPTQPASSADVNSTAKNDKPASSAAQSNQPAQPASSASSQTSEPASPASQAN